MLREHPRPGRVIQRLGNILPDTSGEINARRAARAETDAGMGVTRLGLTTFATEARPRILAIDTESFCLSD
jgi:hypothetical protein